MSIIGIDYSITSPGICVFTGDDNDDWSLEKLQFYCFVSEKKQEKIEKSLFESLPVELHLIESFDDLKKETFDEDVEVDFITDDSYYFNRFNHLATSVCSVIDCLYVRDKQQPKVFVEGYSFGSSGSRLFQIAENAATLKYKLYFELNITNLEFVPPTVVKKFASDKGNANKEMLEECFLEETGIDFRSVFNQTKKQTNPSSDLIDAYYICKYGHSIQK
jgi:hypothetical protein